MSAIKKNRAVIAARAVFLRYGYRRVTMNDIAEAAGMSRPALYVLFGSKEEVFAGVVAHSIDETLTLAETEMAAAGTPLDKLRTAFDVWTVRQFAMVLDSPEAKELIECGFHFAQDALRQGYDRFEAMIAPVLASPGMRWPAAMPPERTAHVLASAVRGFKQTATTTEELGRLIDGLLTLCLDKNDPASGGP